MTYLKTMVSQADEKNHIDFFDFFSFILKYKVSITLTALCFASLGWVYATFKPGQPDTYSASVVLQVGSYISSTGQIFTFESAGDLVQFVHQTTGARASLLRGSSSLIEINQSAHQSEDAIKSLDQVVGLILARHKSIQFLLREEKVVRSTELIRGIRIQRSSIADKRLELVILGLILGFVFGLMMALIWEMFIRFRMRRNTSA